MSQTDIWSTRQTDYFQGYLSVYSNLGIYRKRGGASLRNIMDMTLKPINLLCAGILMVVLCHGGKRLYIMKRYDSGLFSSPEPSGSQGELIVYPWSGVRRTSSSAVVVRPSVRSHFQTSSPLKPLDQSKSNFMWSLLGKRERKFI